MPMNPCPNKAENEQTCPVLRGLRAPRHLLRCLRGHPLGGRCPPALAR